MPVGSGIEAGMAFVRLLIKDEEFQKSISGAMRQLDQFGKQATQVGTTIAAAGAAMTAPFAIAVEVFRRTGDELFTLSQRTNISVDALSELKFAAEQTGASLDTIGLAARNMQAKGLDPALFTEIADEIGKIADPTERAQAAMEIFGSRAGAQLLPMLGNVKELREEANKLGLTMDPDAASAADALDDAFNALKLQTGALASAVGEALAPAVEHAAHGFEGINKGLIEWVKNNNTAVQIAGAVGLAVFALGSAFTFLGETVYYTAHAITFLRSAMTLLAKHPLLIALTVLIVVLTAVYEWWVNTGEATDHATEATKKAEEAAKKQAAAEKELKDALEASAKKVDIKAEALERLTKAQRDAIKAGEQREEQAKEDKLVEELEKKAQIYQIERKLRELRGSGYSNPRFLTYDGLTAGEIAQKIRALETELKILKGEGRPTAGFPFGMEGTGGIGGPAMIFILPEEERGGRKGFTVSDEVNESLQTVFGPRGTFGSRLTPQIFGTDRQDLKQIQKKQLEKQEKMLLELQELNDKLPGGVGPGFKNALV